MQCRTETGHQEWCGVPPEESLSLSPHTPCRGAGERERGAGGRWGGVDKVAVKKAP